MSSSSSTSSDVNSVSSCGSKSHPWRLEAAAGQRINISLLDFTVMDRPRDRVTCRQYGYVLEKLNKRNVSVCGGGGAELRQSHVYMSYSSNVRIILNQTRPVSRNERSYLIKIEGKFISVLLAYNMFTLISGSHVLLWAHFKMFWQRLSLVFHVFSLLYLSLYLLQI